MNVMNTLQKDVSKRCLCKHQRLHVGILVMSENILDTNFAVRHVTQRYAISF